MKFICPNCKAATSLNGHGQITCSGCSWLGQDANGVLNLLPASLNQEKLNEEAIHAENKENSPVWHDFYYKKRIYVDRLNEHWKKHLARKPFHTFLEVAGGLCYLSALVKHQFPNVDVWASDVSPSYLLRKSTRIGRFLDVTLNYAAIDAENLPFDDAQFDVIFITHSIHHIGDTKKFFSEVNRVLRPGGIFFGVDIASPKLDWFYERDKKVRSRRGVQFGINERSIRLRDYREDLAFAGMGDAKISFEKDYPIRGPINMYFKNLYKGVTIKIVYEKN